MNSKPLTVTPVSPISVAPMMDWTDRHERFFLRQISRRVRLYTEMITTGAILHGDRARLLAFNADEHPVALQVGGADPAALAECARIGADFGYDEINLNIGCPSDRVQSGDFGACLMAKPGVVARAVEAMAAAVDLPVTVKHRIAIDDQEEWPALSGFVKTVADAGCAHFIVHARKAWLQGLSPKENRDVPPLDYCRVDALKSAHPDLVVVLNGGLQDLDAAAAALARGLDGVMLGRAAYQTPWVLSDVDRRFFAATPAKLDRHAVVEAMADHAARARRDHGTPVKSIARHMLGLFQGQTGARAWRRYLAETMPNPEAGPEILIEAAALVGPERRAAA